MVMITNEEWDAATGEYLAAERERLGGPPTPEEMVAYQRGELSPEATERVQAALVCYPGLAAALIEPAIDEAAGTLSKEEWEHDRAQLQRGLAEAQRANAAIRPASARRMRLAMAATLVATALGGLILQQREIVLLTRKQSEPRIEPARQRLVLSSGSRRGVGGETIYELPSGEAGAVLLLTLDEYAATYPHYRVDVVVADGVLPIWSGEGNRQPDDNTLELTVPHGFVPPAGLYRIDVYGLGSGNPRLLQHYNLRVGPPSRTKQ
jgi:hypothetical protein